MVMSNRLSKYASALQLKPRKLAAARYSAAPECSAFSIEPKAIVCSADYHPAPWRGQTCPKYFELKGVLADLADDLTDWVTHAGKSSQR